MARKSRYEKAHAKRYGSQIPDNEPKIDVYTVADVAWMTGLDGNDIRKLEARKKFPKRIGSKVGKTRYRMNDVRDWMDDCGEKILKRFLKSLQSGIWWHKTNKIVFFHSPRGFTFENGEHYYGHLELYYIRNYSEVLTLRQCRDYPHCLECKTCSDEHMKSNGWFQL